MTRWYVRVERCYEDTDPDTGTVTRGCVDAVEGPRGTEEMATAMFDTFGVMVEP